MIYGGTVALGSQIEFLEWLHLSSQCFSGSETCALTCKALTEPTQLERKQRRSVPRRRID